MRERIYSTGLIPATPDALRGLAYDAERWQRGDARGQCELEARICAALLSHHGWQYVPPVPYSPEVRQGRKIVQRAVSGFGPRIERTWHTPGDERGHGRSSGSETTPAPHILMDMGLAWGLMHGRALLHLSDISADGLPMAHVGGGAEMRAEGKCIGAATVPAALVVAILRCEAMDREARHAAGAR